MNKINTFVDEGKLLRASRPVALKDLKEAELENGAFESFDGGEQTHRPPRQAIGLSTH